MIWFLSFLFKRTSTGDTAEICSRFGCASTAGLSYLLLCWFCSVDIVSDQFFVAFNRVLIEVISNDPLLAGRQSVAFGQLECAGSTS